METALLGKNALARIRKLTKYTRGIEKFSCFLWFAVLLSASAASYAAAASDPDLFDAGVALLLEKGFDEKSEAIDKLVESEDERCASILDAMLEGKLFALKGKNVLVIGESDGGQYRATDALTKEDLGSFNSRELKKVSINNALRGKLKQAVARLKLSSPDPDARLEAVRKLMESIEPGAESMLARLLEAEADSDVKEALTAAIAIIQLRGADKERRLAALERLSGNLNPAVRNELARLIENEGDPDVLKKAKAALDSIESRVELLEFVETVFFGLSLGSVLVIAAIGLAITFGVIGVINMAHGELIMLGAYTTFVLQELLPNSVGTAFLLAIPAAFLVSGVVGIAIERTVIRFLYGRPLETLLATFGVSLILQQTVRSIFSPLNRSVSSPDWMSGSIRINAALSLTTNRVAVFLFSLLVFAGLFLLLKKSSIGLQVRAVSQNRAMARAMGIRAVRVDALTFGLGSGIAGIAGVALSQLTNVGPNLGQAYIVDSFMVVVFGGVGNLWGTLLGGLTLGVMNKFLEPWTGAVLAKILILVLIILFIQKRPQGLFPQKGRAAG